MQKKFVSVVVESGQNSFHPTTYLNVLLKSLDSRSSTMVFLVGTPVIGRFQQSRIRTYIRLV